MDFEIYYLPTAWVDYGCEFFWELERSNLTSHQKDEVKLRRLKYLKAAARAVLKHSPPDLDSLRKLKVLSFTICLLQLRPRFSDLTSDIIPVLNISELESYWKRLLVVYWASACGGEIPSDFGSRSCTLLMQVVSFHFGVHPPQPATKQCCSWGGYLYDGYCEEETSESNVVAYAELNSSLSVVVVSVWYLVFAVWAY